ncbi:hypothetical protein KM043_004087 [Ampulex compressa]|nr:hypothetical protein KM043_004087 [Ampulex compressa]
MIGCREGIHEIDFKAIFIGAATIRDTACECQYGQVTLASVQADHQESWLNSIWSDVLPNNRISKNVVSRSYAFARRVYARRDRRSNLDRRTQDRSCRILRSCTIIFIHRIRYVRAIDARAKSYSTRKGERKLTRD